MRTKLIMTTFPALIITACAHSDGPSGNSVGEPSTPWESELGGTAWRLVQMGAANDVLTPREDVAYTLVFGMDGTLTVEVDCNRGSGSWSSRGAGKIEFGPIATTRAICPPGSLHDDFLAAIARVDAYALEDEHLLLAAGPEDAVMEFEHAAQAPLAARVLDTEIRTDDAGEMQSAILKSLFERYEEEHGIIVEDSEIEAFIAHLDRVKQADLAKQAARLELIERRLRSASLDASERQSLQAERDRIEEFISNMTDEQSLSAEEALQAAAMRRSFAEEMIMHWKLNQALYQQYGGRVAGQQLGPEPIDAYRKFLEEQSRKGAFEILRRDFERDFWRYFTDDSMHSFLGPEDFGEGGPFASPPWSD